MATQTKPRAHRRAHAIAFRLDHVRRHLPRCIAGALNLIWGVTALAQKELLPRGRARSSPTLQFWGWIALIIAAVQILGGALIFMRKVGGMIMGIVARRCCGVLFNFLSIGAYPVWSSIAIVCSLLVLWAVTVHWEEDL